MDDKQTNNGSVLFLFVKDLSQAVINNHDVQNEKWQKIR